MHQHLAGGFLRRYTPNPKQNSKGLYNTQKHLKSATTQALLPHQPIFTLIHCPHVASGSEIRVHWKWVHSCVRKLMRGRAHQPWEALGACGQRIRSRRRCCCWNGRAAAGSSCRHASASVTATGCCAACAGSDPWTCSGHSAGFEHGVSNSHKLIGAYFDPKALQWHSGDVKRSKDRMKSCVGNNGALRCPRP